MFTPFIYFIHGVFLQLDHRLRHHVLYLTDSIFLILQGGSQFIVRLNKCVPNGTTYDVKFGNYGICKASGSGNEYLRGLKNIPRGTS